MIKKGIIKYTGIALTSLLIAGAISCRKAPTNTSTSGIATIVCDASFENIMDQEIDVFEYNTKGKASIIPYYESEKACIDSLLDFKTKLIVITRDRHPDGKDHRVVTAWSGNVERRHTGGV